MISRRAIALTALVAIVIGLIVVMTLRAFTPDRPALDQAVSAAPTQSVTPAIEPANPVVQPTTAEGPPPWARPGTAAAPAPEPAISDADPRQARQLQKLRQSMQAIAANARQRAAASNVRLRGMVDTLEAMDDPELTSRINLPALRDNLEISSQMLAIAADIHQLYQQPKSPQRQHRIDAATARMNQLHSQLRHDVRKPGAPAMSAAPEAAPAPATTGAQGG